jgi:hypothetical protein
MLTLHINFDQLPPNPSFSTDWDKFGKQMKDTSYPTHIGQNPSDIDDGIRSLTSIISQNIVSSSFPISSNRNLSSLLKNLQLEINFKRHLRSYWQRFRDPIVKTALNNQVTKVKELMSAYNDHKWSNFLESLCDSSIDWQRFFKLNQGMLRKRPATRPLKDPSGTLIHDAKLKVELFANSMVNQFSTPPSTSNTDNLVNDELLSLKSCPRNQPIYFTPGEVWNTIKTLPTRKAPGPDGISNIALKYCGRKTISHICHIFNSCSRAEYFPHEWKQAVIIMIPKPGKDVLNPKNFRPISLLNSISKVFERLLLNRIQYHSSHLIRHVQHGFRHNHSTSPNFSPSSTTS